MKKILIIGNGPSTKELVKFGFENIPCGIDTFGMGLAYKFYEKYNWWPTYYACADSKVAVNNKAKFSEIIQDNNIPVKRFFFPIELVKSEKLEVIPHSSTGDFCFRQAISMNYTEIFIIGIDLSYEHLPEATPLTKVEFDSLGIDLDFNTNRVYKVRKTVKTHPNYFFPFYQEVGDIFSEPRGGSWHLLAWYRMRELAESKKLIVRNVGLSSKLPFFCKESLETALNLNTEFAPEFTKISGVDIARQIFIGEKKVSDRLLKELNEIKNKMIEDYM